MRKNLIAFRGQRSQQEMAKLYHVSQQAWSKWERGIGFPRTSMLIKLESDSGMTIGSLFFNQNDNEKLLNGSGGEPDSAA